MNLGLLMPRVTLTAIGQIVVVVPLGVELLVFQNKAKKFEIMQRGLK